MIQNYLKKLGLLGLVAGGAFLTPSEASAQTACSELFFSEYTEGASGSNKAVEIYNPTNAPISLADYSVKLFSNGVALTAPTATLPLTGTLAAGDVLVIVNSQAGTALLATADITTSGTSANPMNFNGDDALALVKTVGTTESLVDIIGNIGCDPGSDWNNGTTTKSTANRTLRRKASINIGISTDPAGTTATTPNNTDCPFPTLDAQWDDFIDTDYSGFGTHTATGCGTTTTNPVVAFASAAATAAENAGAVTVTVNLTNPSATTATSVTVGAATTGTATAGSDFTFTGSTLTWAAGDNTAKTVTLNIIDDAVLEVNETVILNLTNPSTGATLGTATYTLTIQDNEVRPIPTYTVAQVTTNNPTTMLPDSIGKKVKVVGILYGVNQRTTSQGGIQLTLIDNTGGIGIFASSNTVLPATLPVEGDRIRAIGTVGHFNGLTQITLDSIKVLATNQTLKQPTVVNGPLTEAHESELITIANPVTLATPSQWPATPTTSFNVDVTDGTNTYQMRIVNTSNIYGTAAPTGQFVLTGIGGQFDSSDPRDSGYQIIPRRLTDLRNVTGLSEELSAATTIYPNPASEKLHVTVAVSAEKVTGISIFNTLGQEVKTISGAASEINVANLPAGVYSVKISTANATATKRFVKAD